jgi:hypothetical protein
MVMAWLPHSNSGQISAKRRTAARLSRGFTGARHDSACLDASAEHWHQLQAEEIVRLLEADLTNACRTPSQHRLEKFGPNGRPRAAGNAGLA